VTIEKLVERANQLANTGHWDQAELTWLEVRRLDPQQPQALFSLGVHALQRGDGSGAHALLTNARKYLPRDLRVLMTLCAACKQLGNSKSLS
jgi:Flp pilus assembly protein TadD